MQFMLFSGCTFWIILFSVPSNIYTVHLCGITYQYGGSITIGYFFCTYYRLFISLTAVDSWLNLVLNSKQAPQFLTSVRY